MTIAAVVLLSVGFVYLAWILRSVEDKHARERVLWLEQLSEQAHDAIQERASLLDRIQHPEVRQVEQVEVEPWEPPKDLAELAHLGQIVPDGVTVGYGPES